MSLFRNDEAETMFSTETSSKTTQKSGLLSKRHNNSKKDQAKNGVENKAKDKLVNKSAISSSKSSSGNSGVKNKAGDKLKNRPKASPAEIGLAISKCLLLSVWTALIVMGAQLAVGYLLIWIIGPEMLVQTVWMSVYSAAGYAVGFLVLWLLTPKMLDLCSLIWRKTAGRGRDGKKLKDDKPAKHKIASREELGLKGLPTWTDLGLAPIGYIVASLAAAGLMALFMNFPWYNNEEVQDLTYSTSIEGTERVMAFIVLAVVAPIAEELIFRGWLYGKLRELLGDKMAKWAAITISVLIVSLLFALLHGQWNVGLTVFAMSVVVCLLREMTGSIYAGILVHMIRNALAFYMLFILKM